MKTIITLILTGLSYLVFSNNKIDLNPVAGKKVTGVYVFSKGDTLIKVPSDVNSESNLSNKNSKGLVKNGSVACKDPTLISGGGLSKLEVNFNNKSDTVVLGSSGFNFTNLTIGHNTLSWNFGDGSASSDKFNPEHVFNKEGTFTVELTASDNYCTKIIKKTITVIRPKGADPKRFVPDNIEIYPFSLGAQVKFSLQNVSEAKIDIFSMEKGEWIRNKVLKVQNSRSIILLDNSPGNYIIRVRVNGIDVAKRLSIKKSQDSTREITGG